MYIWSRCIFVHFVYMNQRMPARRHTVTACMPRMTGLVSNTPGTIVSISECIWIRPQITTSPAIAPR